MKELVVISGKGGTGKTSITASFAALAAGKAVIADCDVDAADMHLVLNPTIIKQEEFSGGSIASIIPSLCNACGKCAEICRFDAVSFNGPGNQTYSINPIACEGCGVCAWFCPEKAIDFSPAVNGEYYISDTRCGPMVHARLGVAEENSGKLVTIVRQEARRIADEQQKQLIIIDGSPGIGCPVIASITGASMVLVVTEPTLSGVHDMNRVVDLAHFFNIPAMVCINKWDLNPQISAEIEEQVYEKGAMPAGKIRYDRAVSTAQIAGKSVVEYQNDGCAQEICALWEKVRNEL